jgi:hypothetical protein
MGQALKLATEMIAGVAVGGFIGWALDRWLGTTPILLVVFLISGSRRRDLERDTERTKTAGRSGTPARQGSARGRRLGA